MMKLATLAAALSLTACSATPEQPILIKAETVGGQMLYVARETNKFLRSIKTPTQTDVSIDFASLETDRLGKQAHVPSFRLHFAKDVVNSAQFENLDDIGVMELLIRVEVLSTPAERTVHHFCAPGFYPQFCKLAKADIMQKAEARAAVAP